MALVSSEWKVLAVLACGYMVVHWSCNFMAGFLQLLFVTDSLLGNSPEDNLVCIDQRTLMNRLNVDLACFHQRIGWFNRSTNLQVKWFFFTVIAGC